MTRFILRRLAIIPLALLLIHFFGFAYAHFAGPIRAARTPYVFVQVDPPPLLPTYRDYAQGLLRWDLGTVPGAQEALTAVVGRATMASLGLLALVLILSVPLGLLLGLQATRTNPPRVSHWLTLSSTVGLAMPSFYIGTLFVVASISYVLWKGPGTDIPIPTQGFGWDEHLIFPLLALMVRPTVQIARVTSSLLAEEMGQQHILAARSLGYTWRAIRTRLALSNVLAPVILTVVGSLRLLVGELILIEWLFHWPGLGRLLAYTLIPPLLSSESRQLFLNPPVVAAVLTVFAGLFLVTDLSAAVLVRLLDPRLKTQDEEGLHG